MGRVARGVGAEVLAAVLAVVTYCVGQALSGRFPFGSQTRSINDYGTQLVPQYAHLRDVLTGQADGDLWFNWVSALGVPYLGDLGAYLASPLSVLVVLFPRDEVDLALFVIQQAHLALAAAAMTAYLRRTGSGPWLVAAAIGAAYATCGWAVDDAAVFTTWLTGLIGFPLLALVGEWAISGRRAVLGPLLVALVWFANFYTAYMATIGAALLVLCRLVALGLDRRDAVRVLLRAGWRVGLGIALAAPLLVPVFAANRLAQSSGPAGLDSSDLLRVLPADPDGVLARVLPATTGLGVTAGFYVTTAVLVLAATLPWNRHVPVRERVVYPVGLLAVLVSIFWLPTHTAWHGFDIPDGSPFRQAFVVCGWLAVTAWTAVARHRPDAPAWGAGLVTVGVIWAVGARTEHASAWTTPLVVLSLVVLAAAVVATLRTRWGAPAVGGAMVLLVLVEGSVTAMVVGESHESMVKRPPWTAQHQRVRDAVLGADAWPATRTTVGLTSVPGSRASSAPNDAMLLGGQGAGYYSSLMSRTTTGALQGVGVTYAGFARSILDTDDPARDAVLAIGQRTQVDAQGRVEVAQRPAAPLVSARELPPATANPFLNRNALAGAQAYTVPATQVLSADGTALAPDAAGEHVVAGSLERPERPGAVLVATCPAGTAVHLTAPRMAGHVRTADGRTVEILPVAGRAPGRYRGAGPLDLGPAPAGELRVEVFGSPTVLPAEPLACYDQQVMDDGVRALQETAATVTTGGHSFVARWDDGVDGAALVLVTAVRGWRCTNGEQWRRPDNASGFISFDMAGSDRLECSYRPPGVQHGAAVGLLALAALLVPPGLRRLRARRQPT